MFLVGRGERFEDDFIFGGWDWGWWIFGSGFGLSNILGFEE